MANQMTGDLYSREDMTKINEAFSNDMDILTRRIDNVEVKKKDIVEITEKQYAKMESMAKPERIKYIGSLACPCGSRKKRRMCCGGV